MVQHPASNGTAKFFLQALEVKLAALNSLRELIGQPGGQLNYTAVVNAITTDNLAGILHHLEEEFGSGYIIYFLMRPYNDALVRVDHHRLAQAIIGK